ncbi:lipase [Streptomyces sp. LP05-1]|uniref:Lipase n=1 Tax=Streptomyces pyxinae TaxID=2970734 RepID=A0ABT2CEJ6_9ACTN|nr:lipase family protein [Streptomyces sp. LP05-1]MCS0635745.1 lipase [Streptomyces sp. LP05-1]
MPASLRRPRAVTVLALSVTGALGLVGALTPPVARAASETPAVAPERGPATAVSPPSDDFYVPPGPLPAGRPGDVIRSRKVDLPQPTPNRLADTWQVMYLSTDALGRPDAVTGTVLVPRGADPATLPVIGWAPGTQGPAFRCTASRMIARGALYEQWVVNSMLASGYAVAITDYEGYRPDPETTYVVGKSMGPALIDAVRAAQRLPATGLSPAAKVVFRGYSQGGGAALWAGETQPGYAPELNVKGVVAGGVPASLVDVALPLNGGPGSGFLLDALIGLDHAYPELRLDDALNDAGRAAVADLEKDACALDLLTTYANKSLSDLTTRSPLADPAWQKRYTENTLGGSTQLKVPVYLYHATRDSLVDAGQAGRLRGSLCRLGAEVTWKAYDTDALAPVKNHLWPIQAGNAEAAAFVADRLADKPATSNC